MKDTFAIRANLWEYPGESATWHFVTIPKEISKIIKQAQVTRRGWGSVRVRAGLGETSWDTSIFPDAKTGTYLLPIKAIVRRTEGVYAGDRLSVTITLLK